MMKAGLVFLAAAPFRGFAQDEKPAEPPKPAECEDLLDTWHSVGEMRIHTISVTGGDCKDLTFNVDGREMPAEAEGNSVLRVFSPQREHVEMTGKYDSTVPEGKKKLSFDNGWEIWAGCPNFPDREYWMPASATREAQVLHFHMSDTANCRIHFSGKDYEMGGSISDGRIWMDDMSEGGMDHSFNIHWAGPDGKWAPFEVTPCFSVGDFNPDAGYHGECHGDEGIKDKGMCEESGCHWSLEHGDDGQEYHECRCYEQSACETHGMMWEDTYSCHEKLRDARHERWQWWTNESAHKIYAYGREGDEDGGETSGLARYCPHARWFGDITHFAHKCCHEQRSLCYNKHHQGNQCHEFSREEIHRLSEKGMHPADCH